MADGKFQDVEQGHLRLEESIDRLRQSLQHWQTWDAEYEGLKEEILAHKSNFSEDGLSTIGRDFGGTLLRDKEIKEVLQDGRGNIRSPKQVADVLSRRIDYVQDNIRIIEKQLDSAEGMLSSLQGQKSSSEEDTLPLTEILEELDEVGNVISSSTSTPGSVAPQLLEVLQKAGLDDPDHVKEGEYGETVAETARSEDLHRSTKRASAMATPTSPTSPDFGSEPSDALPSRRKKSVTFTQDTKVEAPASSKLKFAPRKARQDETVEPAIIPTDESEGDAALRKDMLKYGLSEVGAVVAELELDDSGTLGSYSDDDTDYLDGDESVSTTDEDEDEDDHGRSKKRVLDDEYLGRMEALSKKLDARMIENVGPDPADSQTSKDEPDSTDKGVNDDSSGKKSTKKGVRFAEEVANAAAELSSETERLKAAAPTAQSARTALRDAVIERAGPAIGHPPVPNPAPGNVSKFKSSRMTSSHPSHQSNAILSHPPATPLAPTLIERTPAALEDPGHDDLDETLHSNEIATAYHAQRTARIQRQGGFLPTEEEQERVPLTEEEGGLPGRKKKSRFMTARLATDRQAL